MKDVFSPIFLLTLLLLFIFHHLNVFSEILQPFVFVFFIFSLILFILKKYKFSYLFITISISLLIVFTFLRGKENFVQKKEFHINENHYISIQGQLKNFPEMKKDHSIIYLKSEFLEYNKKKFSDNNHSQVIKISNNFHSFLFTGDIEKKIEDQLVKTKCTKLEADVLKVPHHGSRSSSSVPFLKCIKPGIAIFSFASNNRFQFPHKKTKESYKKQNTKMISTAKRGGIKITSTSKISENRNIKINLKNFLFLFFLFTLSPSQNTTA